jgi:predicted nucleic acid-binding protein
MPCGGDSLQLAAGRFKYFSGHVCDSELVKTKPDLRVAQWVRSQDEESLFLSVITIGEIQKGIFELPDGLMKKAQLQNWMTNELKERFKDRILEITIGAACARGQILGACEKKE